MNVLKHNSIVTGPVEVGSHRASWIGASSPAVPISTIQGRAKWRSHKTDNGFKTDYNIDRPNISAPLTHCTPLRLRGGNDDVTDDIESQSIEEFLVTPTKGKNKKRKAGKSTPGTVPDSISTEVNVIDGLVRDCKVFINDMIITTKVGKKWSEGIKEFLSKIQACSTNIALEAAAIAGKYQEAKLEVKEANNRLMLGINDEHEQQRP